MELKPSTDSINVTIDENNIVIVRAVPGQDITINDVQSTFYWALKQHRRKQKMDVIIVGAQGISFDAESREFFKSVEFQQHLNHYALVVRNFGHRLFVDLLFKFGKPIMKYKIFTSEAQGLKWIREQQSIA